LRISLTDVSTLVGLKLEAIDRKNIHLRCVATITQVNVETNEILIHFDGWGNNFDYWTDLSSNEIFPAGFTTYMQHLQSTIQLEYVTNLTPNLEKPKGNMSKLLSLRILFLLLLIHFNFMKTRLSRSI